MEKSSMFLLTDTLSWSTGTYSGKLCLISCTLETPHHLIFAGIIVKDYSWWQAEKSQRHGGIKVSEIRSPFKQNHLLIFSWLYCHHIWKFRSMFKVINMTCYWSRSQIHRIHPLSTKNTSSKCYGITPISVRDISEWTNELVGETVVSSEPHTR